MLKLSCLPHLMLQIPMFGHQWDLLHMLLRMMLWSRKSNLSRSLSCSQPYLSKTVYEYMLRAEFSLPSVTAEEATPERKALIRVKFEMPYFTVSGLQDFKDDIAIYPDLSNIRWKDLELLLQNVVVEFNTFFTSRKG